MMADKLQRLLSKISAGTVRRAVFMTGAGISTPSGIPDFRDPKTGIYANLAKYKLPYAEAIFDIDYFVRNPIPFFQFAKELYPSSYCKPNVAHYLMRLFHEKDKLLRVYTQNIDGLELRTGLPEYRLVAAHGSLTTAKCIACYEDYDGSVVFNIIKPNVVFFGEQLPGRFMKYLVDLPLCDLLVVMGTSLEVEPFASICEYTLRGTPRLLINRDAVGTFRVEEENDVLILGPLVELLTTE